MTSIISDFYGSLNKSFRSKNQRVRCISITILQDADDIELEMENHGLIVIFFREFRIKHPMEAKRFLQYLNAYIRKYHYSILNLGKFDYFLLLPKEFELTKESLLSH